MKLIEKFKEPINKHDLMLVIRQGVFMTVIGGLLVGAMNLFIEQFFGITLIWMMLFIFGLYLARRFKEAYTNYHIIYSVIAIVVIIVTFYLSKVVYFAGYLYMNDVLTVTSLSYFCNPVLHFSFLNVFQASFFEVTNILNVIFFILVNVYVVRYVK